jgi:alkylresorcinol/alkylpyrone synthase
LEQAAERRPIARHAKPARRPAPASRFGASRATASVVGFGTAFPPAYAQDELWAGFFAEHHGNDRVARQIWHGCGVRQRHAAVDPRVEDLRFAGTEARMRAFASAGMPLAVEAVERCLDDARLDACDVGHLTVVSCTGYGSPGIEIGLMRELGLGASVQRLHVRDMGCYAAIPALAASADAAGARAKVGLVVCVELTSLHVQPPSDDRAQVVAHALFSDAAVATAVVPVTTSAPHVASRSRAGTPRQRVERFEVIDVAAFSSLRHAPLMTWDVTDLGFRMGLSPHIARVLRQHVGSVVEDLLAPHGLTVEDVRRWAVHPGGPAILDVIEERLELSDGTLCESRAVLAEHGNCSSPTVLLVLDRIRQEGGLRDGDPVVAMAFGPGLTLYTTLLRSTTSPR